MRITAMVVALGLGAAAHADAQIAINELAAPTSPAFVLLDVSPSSIERPESAKGFVVNAINKLTSAQGFPKDYALEVAPYWMRAHPTLSFDQYQNPSIVQNLRQSFVVSVATSPIAAAQKGADPLGTHLAVGLHTKVLNGRPHPAMTAKLEFLAKSNDVLFRLDDEKEALEKEVAAKETELAAATTTEAKAPVITVLEFTRKQLAAKNEAIVKQEGDIKRTSLEVQAFDAQRVGAFLAVSAGQVFDFVGDDTANAEAKRRGFWLTPAYRKVACMTATADCQTTVDFIGVVRVLKDPGADRMIDYGGKLAWHPKKSLNLSFEALRRIAPEDAGPSNESSDDSNRMAGMIEYQITDDFSLYGTFGQDFKKATGAKPLVSLLGLNFGFGSKAEVR
jgi:hypothetical protein